MVYEFIVVKTKADLIKKGGEKAIEFFPLFISIFILVTFFNIVGLLFFPTALVWSYYIGFYPIFLIIGFFSYRVRFIKLFLPSGNPKGLNGVVDLCSRYITNMLIFRIFTIILNFFTSLEGQFSYFYTFKDYLSIKGGCMVRSGSAGFKNINRYIIAKIKLTPAGSKWYESLPDEVKYSTGEVKTICDKKVFEGHPHIIEVEANPDKKTWNTLLLSHDAKKSLHKISDEDVDGKQYAQHVTAYFNLHKEDVDIQKEHSRGELYVCKYLKNIENAFEEQKKKGIMLSSKDKENSSKELKIDPTDIEGGLD